MYVRWTYFNYRHGKRTECLIKENKTALKMEIQLLRLILPYFVNPRIEDRKLVLEKSL